MNPNQPGFIRHANPVGSFLQGQGVAQQNKLMQMQMQGAQQQQTFDNDLRMRQENRAQQGQDFERQRWLAENLPEAVKWADTPEKWAAATDYLVQLGFDEAANFRDKFEMRPLVMVEMGQSDDPAAVREYQYYSNLDPEQRDEYLRVKRSGTVREIGGVPTFVGPDQSINPLSDLPTETGAAGAIAEAEAAGARRGRGEIPEDEKKAKFRENVTSAVEEAVRLYGQLDEMGAIPSTEGGVLRNVGAYAGASPAGQVAGKMFGTEAQSVRNQINQLRPTLINYIRQASEMGARGLDSEKELEFYLQAATDPQRDVQSNLAALKVLDDAYGIGTGVKASNREIGALKDEFQEAFPDGDVPEGIDPEDWAALTPEERALWRN